MGKDRAWKFVLEVYVINAGHIMNLDKSKVFFFNTPHIQWRILNIFGCNIVGNIQDYARLLRGKG